MTSFRNTGAYLANQERRRRHKQESALPAPEPGPPAYEFAYVYSVDGAYNRPVYLTDSSGFNRLYYARK